MHTISHQKAFVHKKAKKPLSARYNTHLKVNQETKKRHQDQIDSKKMDLFSRSLRSKNSIIPAFDSEQSIEKRQKDLLSQKDILPKEDCVSSINLHNIHKPESTLNIKSLKVQSMLTSCTQTTKSCNLKKIDETIKRQLSSKKYKKYQQLKAEHQKQHKLFSMVLNPKQMHRLQKIYQTEEAKYLITVLECQPKNDMF